MYDVVAAPSTLELTTLEALKEELGICADDGSKDPKLKRAIQRASAMIVGRVGRPIARHTVTERLPSTAQRRQWLKVRPVITLTSVKRDGQTLDPEGYVLERTKGAVFRQGGWESHRLLGYGVTQYPTHEYSENVYQFDYQGGYYLPTFTTALDGAKTALDVDLPADIELAAVAMAKILFHRSERNLEVQSESLGDHSVTYAKPASQQA